jgi:hypothetical protein
MTEWHAVCWFSAATCQLPSIRWLLMVTKPTLKLPYITGSAGDRRPYADLVGDSYRASGEADGSWVPPGWTCGCCLSIRINLME